MFPLNVLLNLKQDFTNEQRLAHALDLMEQEAWAEGTKALWDLAADAADFHAFLPLIARGAKRAGWPHMVQWCVEREPFVLDVEKTQWGYDIAEAVAV